MILGCITFVALVINTLFWFIPLLVAVFLRVIPSKSMLKYSQNIASKASSKWTAVNNWYIKNILKCNYYGFHEDLDLSVNKTFLVISNHQSWLDIVVLQSVLYGKVPDLKFFIKDELKWVPILGIAWWILDFPFMKRYSKAYLKKHPHKQGCDLEKTKKSCMKFKSIPISLMIFPEGSRFNQEKLSKQKSSYKNLLKPKAGGIAYSLSILGDQVSSVIDVTIKYERQIPSLWDFMCGKIKHINLTVNQLPIKKSFYFNDYSVNDKTKDDFKQWIDNIWLTKDRLLSNHKDEITNKN